MTPCLKTTKESMTEQELVCAELHSQTLTVSHYCVGSEKPVKRF